MDFNIPKVNCDNDNDYAKNSDYEMNNDDKMDVVTEDISNKENKYYHKRRFHEIGISSSNLDEEFNTLTITKRIKLNSNDTFISKSYNSPPNHITNNKEVIDMQKETERVSEYYREKNRILFEKMFN